MVIEVVRSDNDMSRQVWRFVLLENALVVEEYRQESRPTRKHTIKVTHLWQRLNLYSREKQAIRIEEAAVPLPADVIDEARTEYMKRIQVGFLSQIRGAK